MAKDLYASLGVSRGASTAEIKKAFRALAKQHHPDANGGTAAGAERFKEVSAAFEVLGDPERRALYDEFGEESLRPGFDPAKARAYQQWTQQAARGGGRGWQGVGYDDASAGPFGFDDLFGDLFGARRGPMQRSRQVSRVLEIDLATALRGGTVRLNLDEQQPCAQCGGRGRVGRAARTVCMACQGSGQSVAARVLSVTIPARTPDGSKLTLRGQGPRLDGEARGDLVLEVRLQPHPVFRRDGKDLLVELPVRVDEAVLGARVPLVTPDGRTLTVTIAPGSQSGQALRLKGQGLGTGRRAGHLIATLSVRVPRQGGEQAARSLREAYRQEVEVSPRAA